MNRSSPLPPRDRPPFDQADSATGAGSAALRHSFTPGPWTFGFEPYEDGCPYVRISAGEHGMFEDETGTGFNLSGIVSEADGRLMAAASELYEALDALMAHAPDYADTLWLNARDALAKARGQA